MINMFRDKAVEQELQREVDELKVKIEVKKK